MATELSEMNFELLPNLKAASGLVFGIGQAVSIDDEGFDPGEDEWTVEDDDNPRRGGTIPGRDTLSGPTWNFALHTNRSNTKQALESLAAFKRAWRALEIRDTPGAVTVLRYRVGGRARKVYGRPRRFAAPPSNRILGGFVPITTDFKCVDGFTYSDVEHAAAMTITAEDMPRGFTFPQTFPTTTNGRSLGRATISVDGDAPAYPRIIFTGPLTNPMLTHKDWTLTLDEAILSSQSVTIDLRPWAMTAIHSNGWSVAGKLKRSSRLTDVKFQPGPNELAFRAASTLTSGTCTVRWSDTWNSI